MEAQNDMRFRWDLLLSPPVHTPHNPDSRATTFDTITSYIVVNDRRQGGVTTAIENSGSEEASNEIIPFAVMDVVYGVSRWDSIGGL
jgi:hypothetical protein